MVTCAVPICKNTSSKITKNKNGISFHRFPRDKLRCRQWEIAINREADWSATTSSAICSEHFDSGDFYLTDSGLRRLSFNAVPSINISPCQEPAPTISQLDPVDISPSDSEEVLKLKHKVRRLEVMAESRRRKLLLVCQRTRRLQTKLHRMKQIIRHLIKVKKDTDIG